MEINATIGASAEGLAGITYLDFFKNFLQHRIDSNQNFVTEKLKASYKGGYNKFILAMHDKLREDLKEQYETLPKCSIKAFSNKYINISYGAVGFIRLVAESGDILYHDESTGSDVDDSYVLYVTGDPWFVSAVQKVLIPLRKRINLSWYYMTASGHSDQVDIELKNDQTIHDEHYPYLTLANENGRKATVDEFCSSYLNSKSSILILNGPPGTGKTSFIRYLIDKHEQKTIVTYDEKILKDEKFFIDFLTQDEADLMVIEDAELILTSRQNDGNKIMSKLLNVSEGLVKLFQKKIIFTTNQPSTANFDEAIIRPGRCHDIVTFRELTLEEAIAVCVLNNIPPPTQDRLYTLAELFNTRVKSSTTPKTGFF